MALGFENEPRIVEEVAILDLDRTLIHSSFVVELVLAELVHYGVSLERVGSAINYVESQAGSSFELFDYIEREFSPQVLAAVVSSVQKGEAMLDEAMRNRLLCDGADALIDALEDRRVPYVILTYGEDRYQNFKIALFNGLINRLPGSVPAIVVNANNKSHWVQDSWFKSSEGELGEIPRGVIQEGAVLPRSVTIIDDKKEHLNSDDDRILGILVNNESLAQSSGAMSTRAVADAVTKGMTLKELAYLSGGSWGEAVSK